MKNGVPIARLKASLSEYLRRVRAGRSVVVLDRTTPIARIVPYHETETLLLVRKPLSNATRLQKFRFPPPLKIRSDIVSLLLEERQGDR